MFTQARYVVLSLSSVLALGCGSDTATTNSSQQQSSESPDAAPAARNGHIVGFVFEDRNGNGTYDAGETRMPAQRVSLTDPSASQGIQSTTSAADGGFRLDGIPPGDYRVTIEIPEGFRRANDSSFVLTVPEGEAPPEVEFGLSR